MDLLPTFGSELVFRLFPSLTVNAMFKTQFEVESQKQPHASCVHNEGPELALSIYSMLMVTAAGRSCSEAHFLPHIPFKQSEALALVQLLCSSRLVQMMDLSLLSLIFHMTKWITNWATLTEITKKKNHDGASRKFIWMTFFFSCSIRSITCWQIVIVEVLFAGRILLSIVIIVSFLRHNIHDHLEPKLFCSS